MNRQLNLFDYTRSPFKITNKIRLIELFAGVGSQAMALRDIGADFETYRAIEFDKYAMGSYNAIHGTNFETSDIRNIHAKDLAIVDTDNYTYIVTYSFPCQDLSVAGKRAGMSKGDKTRSGLLWEVERILNECNELPQVLLMENVTQVHGEENRSDFYDWIEFLEGKGYSNYWQDLNAKDYGVAQNRDRCFMVSLLGEYNFHFPDPIPLTKTMKDYLEPEVDEKFYINNEKAKQLIQEIVDNGTLDDSVERTNERTNERVLMEQSTSQNARTLQTASRQDTMQESQINDQMEHSLRKVGFIDKGTGEHQSNQVFDSDGIIPCQSASQYKEPIKICVK